MSQLQYRVEIVRPACHRFRVTLHITESAGDVQQVSLAAWTPGSYMIRDFARNVVRFEVLRDGVSCAARKLDKQTWELPGGAPLEVRYEIHAWDPSVRAAYLDLHRGFFDGACLFLRVHGQEKAASRVELVAPADERCSHWRVATTMPAHKLDSRGFGSYVVSDYEELIDHPFEIGDFREVTWEVGGVPHGMVLAGGFRMDEERLARDLARICATEIALFGSAPFAHYRFLTHVTADGYGGLEHRASSALICTRRSLPAPGVDAADEKYRDFLGLCSHEYFHAWNVKRIRPRALQEADLSAETHTRLLWVFEGFTAYYDELVLARSAVISTATYLEMLGETFTRVLRGGGRHMQSIAASSFDAWTRFYKQDARAPNLIVSYYAKGALVALALDLHIRLQTDQARSLDDVMRLLWDRHGEAGTGLAEDAMPALIREATGVDVHDELDAWVEGVADPPWAELLAGQGVALQLGTESSLQDRGGRRPAQAAVRQVAGWRCDPEQGFPRVRQVVDESPAGDAGLAPGDLLVAVAGWQARVDELDTLVDRCDRGEQVPVHYLRDGMLRETTLVLREGPRSTAWLEVQDAARVQQWIGAPA